MELPCLVMNVCRCGPGLGNIAPHQGDYYQATRGGGHGDYRMITLDPASVHEMAEHAHLGFELACKWRNPALIATDGVIGQMMEPVDLDAIPVVEYKAPAWALGVNNTGRERNVITSIFLDPEEMGVYHEHLIAKYELIKKNETRHEEMNLADADILCVAYGSVSRVVSGAVRELRAKGVKVGLLRPITVWPFPYEAIRRHAQGKQAVVVLEMSWGQMVEDVALATRHNPAPLHFVPKHGGITFTPAEIEQVIEQIQANPQNPATLWEAS
jgi:2-oxoglutarate ferredoxin oxidoreductase subunit alpha